MKNLTYRAGCGVILAMMEDKRLTKRLNDYWNRLRKEQPLPQWEKFNVGSLQDIWGQCCVWRVEINQGEKQERHYIFEYVGQEAQHALGKDLTGLTFMSHLQQFPAARIAGKIEEVVQAAVPLLDEGTFVNELHKIVKYRSCLLPFGTREGVVNHIVLGLSWKAF